MTPDEEYVHRRARSLNGMVVHEETSVHRFGTGRGGLRRIQESLRRWGKYDTIYNRSLTPQYYPERLKILAAARVSRDEARVALVLRRRAVVLARVLDDMSVEYIDELTEVLLEPLKIELMPDGSYVFYGVEHTSFSWPTNYGGDGTEHTYKTYKVTVSADRQVSYEITDTEHTNMSRR